MKTIEKKRIQWIDTAKGITIILVIIGHANFQEPIKAFIYSFHMPLFFFLSGLFINTESDFNSFLTKRIKGLIIPYLIYNIILLLFYWFLNILSQDSTSFKDSIFIKIISLPLAIRVDNLYSTKLWFLPCLFISSIIVYLLPKNKKLYLTLGIIITSIGILFCNVLQIKFLPWSIDAALLVVIFLIISSLLREYINWGNLLHSNLLLILCIPLSIIFTILNYRYLGNHRVDIYESNYGNFAYFYIAAFAGIYIILNISKRLNSIKVLSYLGRNSIIIYVTHYIYLAFGFQIVKFIPIIYNQCFSQIINGTIITIICIIGSFPTIKFINKYMLWSIGK